MRGHRVDVRMDPQDSPWGGYDLHPDASVPAHRFPPRIRRDQTGQAGPRPGLPVPAWRCVESMRVVCLLNAARTLSKSLVNESGHERSGAIPADGMMVKLSAFSRHQ